jgi:hypothetical protein
MWSMENPYLAEKDNSNSTSLALADLAAQATKQGLDVLPRDVAAGWVSEDGRKSALVCALHERNGTTDGYQAPRARFSDA